MKRGRRSQRRRAELPIPKRPFRDSAIVYGVMATLIVVVAYITGGSLARAVAYAAVFFLLATAWNWWRFRRRLEEEQRRP